MDPYSLLWPIHAGLMTLGFLSMGTGIYINMFLKKAKWRIKVHKRLGYLGTAAAFTAFVIAFVMVQISHGYHFSTLHSIAGAVTLVLIVLNPVAGYLMLKKGMAGKKELKTYHRWAGRVLLLSMGVVIFFGLYIAGII